MRHKTNVTHDPDPSKTSESFESLVFGDADIVKPILKERFLKDYILGIGDSDSSFAMYCRAFDTDRDMPVRMIFMKPVSPESYDEMFYIQGIGERYLGADRVILSTSLSDCVIMLVCGCREDELRDMLEDTVKSVKRRCDSDILSVYSREIPLSDIPETYEKLRECSECLFYFDEIKVMSDSVIVACAGIPMIAPDYSGIEKAVSGGDEENAADLLKEFFAGLEDSMPNPAVAKTYCLELYVCIIRCCKAEKIDKYMKGIVSIQQGKSFGEIKEFIYGKAAEIVKANAPDTANMYSSLIKDTLRVIDENIGNEKLSLRWIAGTILYTNVDYLGKIFKKETGKNFSHFVMEKRMEFAKQLIMGGEKDRIYEVAEKVGYGANSQYFSQVFKKYTGISPLEYKESTRQLSAKQNAPSPSEDSK